MPVVTFTEFLVEQALGIAIGAIAVMAAPKAGPKFAELTGTLADGIRSTLAPAPEKAPAIGSVAELLPTVSRSLVVSQAPGRVRLRIRSLQRQPLLAEQTTEALMAMGGIRLVQASPRTGSVLVLYDNDRYPSVDSLLTGISQW